MNLKTAPRSVRTFAALADGNSNNFGDETFHRQADTSMLSRQRGQRTAHALDQDLTVGLHLRKRAKMFVHQLAGFEDARLETSSKPFSPSQFMSETLARFSKECLQLIGWQSLCKDIDQLSE